MSFKQNKGKIVHGSEVTEIDMEAVGKVNLPAGAIDSLEEIAGEMKIGDAAAMQDGGGRLVVESATKSMKDSLEAADAAEA